MNFRQFFTTHTWWGKILGAFFGYIIAGSIGALFGILIGNFFDRGLADHFSRPLWLYHQEKRKMVQKIFFSATFGVMGHIAKADGRVSKQEIAMALSLMDEMRLSKEQKKAAKDYFNAGKQSSFSLDNCLTDLLNICHDNPELLKLFMDTQYRAAMADGLSEPKINVLNKLFSRLGFAPLHQQYRFYEDFTNYSSSSYQTNQQQRQSSNRQHHYQNPPHHLTHAYALLEISPEASKSDVKRAYRRLISRNHPDKLIAKGLPEEMIKLANDKTQKLTKAYDLICASKGW